MIDYDISSALNESIQQTADNVAEMLSSNKNHNAQKSAEGYVDTLVRPVGITVKLHKVAENLVIEEALPVLRKNRDRLMLVKDIKSIKGSVTKMCFILTKDKEFVCYQGWATENGAYGLSLAGINTHAIFSLSGSGLLEEDFMLYVLPRELRC